MFQNHNICSYTEEVGYTNVNFISCQNSRNCLVKMFSKNECIPQFPRLLVSLSRKLSMEYLTIRIYLEDKVDSLYQYTYHTLIHHHWMSSFCNCAISLTNCKFYWIFKGGLRHVLYVMSSRTSFVYTYLPIEPCCLQIA